MLKAEEVLEGLRCHVPAVHEVAVRLLGPDAHVDSTSGALCLAHRPKIGSEACAIRVYPGVSETLIGSYEEINHCQIADRYRCLLQWINGASLFEISLFGVPPLMAKRPPQIDRTTAWPLDIGTAQKNWRLDYNPTSTDFFIGSGPYSEEERVGYFLWPNGGIEALRKNGQQFAQWSDFHSFLVAEIARAEAVYAKFEDAMEPISRESSGWRSWLGRVTGIRL